MINNHDRCELVNVLSGTGSSALSQTSAESHKMVVVVVVLVVVVAVVTATAAAIIVQELWIGICDCGAVITENQDPPPRKRLRHSSEERVTRSSEREGTLRDKNQMKSADDLSTYSAELLLYDRHRRCTLSAGRYDVAVEEPKTSNSSPPIGKHSTWETVTDDKVPYLVPYLA